ncbi:MAG: TetR/AcrR family transcriptional regulator [Anaerolineae bacterium]|nr:TetR/AcrR family transcriptional regulator [Anaerolineae bacterium]
MSRELSPEKKALYLETALKLFITHGVNHTSTAEIAKQAGTAAGTLFLYFPAKQDLINELVLGISREQSLYIRSLLSTDLPSRQAFFQIWQGSIDWFLLHLDAYLYIQQIRDSNLVPETVIQQTALDLVYYFETIQKGFKEGALKPYPPELIGEILYQDIVAVMNHIKRLHDPQEQKRIALMGFEIFWNGICASKENGNEI